MLIDQQNFLHSRRGIIYGLLNLQTQRYIFVINENQSITNRAGTKHDVYVELEIHTLSPKMMYHS